MRYSGKGLNAGPGPWWVELLLFLREGDENEAGEEIGQTMEGLAAIGRFCSLAWGRKQLSPSIYGKERARPVRCCCKGLEQRVWASGE